MAFVDTNIILRWLLNDHTELSPKAERLIAKAAAASLIITDVIAGEIFYVLHGYDYTRYKVSESILLLTRTPAFRFENQEMILALNTIWITTNLDFADCYLLARAINEKKSLETFDVALAKRHAQLTH